MVSIVVSAEFRDVPNQMLHLTGTAIVVSRTPSSCRSPSGELGRSAIGAKWRFINGYATVILVCDNLNTHTIGGFYRSLSARTARRLVRRIRFCHTPKHGSWLNIAENELSSLTRQCVSGRRFGVLTTLQSEIAAWSNDVNNTQRGVDWQMKISDARYKLKSLYPKIRV